MNGLTYLLKGILTTFARLIKPIYLIIWFILKWFSSILVILYRQFHRFFIAPLGSLIVYLSKQLLKGGRFVILKIDVFLIKPLRTMLVFVVKSVFKWLNYGYKKLIEYIFKPVKNGIVFIYQVIIKKSIWYLYKKLSPMIKTIYRGIYLVIKKIYEVLSFIAIKLFSVIKVVLGRCFKFVTWVYGGIARLLRWCYRHILRMIQSLFEVWVKMYVFVLKLPSGLFLWVKKTLFGIIWLFKAFLYVFIFKLVFQGLSILLNKLLKVLELSLAYLSDFIVFILHIFEPIGYQFRRLFSAVKNFIYDYSNDYFNYTMIILFSPVLLLIFLALCLLYGIKSIVRILYIACQSIAGIGVSNVYELIKYKHSYLPSQLFYQSLRSVIKEIEIDALFKNGYAYERLMIESFVFRILSVIFLPVFFIGLMPLSLFGYLYLIVRRIRLPLDAKSNFLFEHLIINNELKEVAYIRSFTFQNAPVTIEILSSAYEINHTNTYVFDKEAATIHIRISYQGQMKRYELNHTQSTNALLLYEKEEIKREIQKQKLDGFDLPSGNYETYYEPTKKGDWIEQGKFYIRPYRNKTDVLITIKKEQHKVSERVSVFVINKNRIEELKNQREIYLRKGANLRQYLSDTLSLKFTTNQVITNSGKIKKCLYGTYDVTYAIKNTEVVITQRIIIQPSKIETLKFKKLLKKQIEFMEFGVDFPKEITNSWCLSESLSYYNKGLEVNKKEDLFVSNHKQAYLLVKLNSLNQSFLIRVLNNEYVHNYYENQKDVLVKRLINKNRPLKKIEIKKQPHYIIKKPLSCGLFKMVMITSLNQQVLSETGLIRQTNKAIELTVKIYRHPFEKRVYIVTLDLVDEHLLERRKNNEFSDQ